MKDLVLVPGGQNGFQTNVIDIIYGNCCNKPDLYVVPIDIPLLIITHLDSRAVSNSSIDMDWWWEFCQIRESSKNHPIRDLHEFGLCHIVLEN